MPNAPPRLGLPTRPRRERRPRLLLGMLLAGFALLPQARAGLPDRPRAAPCTVASYDLELQPHPGTLTFDGRVRAAFATATVLQRLTLQAADLVPLIVTLDGRTTRFALHPAQERLDLLPVRPLLPGPHTLDITYRGGIQRSGVGLFAMDYPDGGAQARVLLTDLEPDDARRLLPCWDVPAAKATFRLRVLAPPGQEAISNMPAAALEPAPGGGTWVTFQPTPRMSSYLLFLGVGRFQRTHRIVAGVDLGVITVAGATGRAEVALDAAARLLPFYNAYFGLPFPLPKLDLISAPGAIASVAMENWGAILLSESVLLSTGRGDAAGEARRICATVAHELSHQWFGNLVTMAWWDDLWLNEGFASWMDLKATDRLHPEWEVWLTSGAPDKEAAMNEDEKGSTHPIVQPIGSVYQAEQSFDMITYKKGMATVQMLERYVGEEAFRAGVRAYLARHALGTATSGDLWAELERASGRPVARVMRSYTLKAGVPLVEVLGETPAGPDTTVTLRRSRYEETGAPRPPLRVSVPLVLQGLGDAAPVQVLLEDDRPHAVTVPGPGPVRVNAGRHTYARVRYAPALLDRLQARWGGLPPADQLGLIYDTWAFNRSSLVAPGRLLELLTALPADGDPAVWQKAVEILERIDHLHGASPGRAAFRAFARRLLQPVALRVGWTPAEGEPPVRAGLRASVLIALARFGDRAVLEDARARFQAGAAAASPETWPVIRAVTAMHADRATFEALLAPVLGSGSTLDQEQLLTPLTEVEDPALARRLLELSLSDRVPGGLGPLLVMAIGEHHPDLTWAFVMAHLDRLPRESDTPLITVPSIAEASLRPSRARDLARFTRARFAPADRHTAREAILALRFNLRVHRRVLPGLDAWCARRDRDPPTGPAPRPE